MKIKMDKVTFLREMRDVLSEFYDWANKQKDYVGFCFNFGAEGEFCNLSYYEPNGRHRYAASPKELGSLLKMERYGVSALISEITRLRKLIPIESRVPEIIHAADTDFLAQMIKDIEAEEPNDSEEIWHE